MKTVFLFLATALISNSITPGVAIADSNSQSISQIATNTNNVLYVTTGSSFYSVSSHKFILLGTTL
jgi:hypothetical protein